MRYPTACRGARSDRGGTKRTWHPPSFERACAPPPPSRGCRAAGRRRATTTVSQRARPGRRRRPCTGRRTTPRDRRTRPRGRASALRAGGVSCRARDARRPRRPEARHRTRRSWATREPAAGRSARRCRCSRAPAAFARRGPRPRVARSRGRGPGATATTPARRSFRGALQTVAEVEHRDRDRPAVHGDRPPSPVPRRARRRSRSGCRAPARGGRPHLAHVGGRRASPAPRASDRGRWPRSAHSCVPSASTSTVARSSRPRVRAPVRASASRSSVASNARACCARSTSTLSHHAPRRAGASMRASARRIAASAPRNS